MTDYIVKEYDEALRSILETGEDIYNERTKSWLKVKIGVTTRYDISKRVPILTKRKLNWKTIVKEILWIISGSDNIYDLQKLGSHIWDYWIDNNFTGDTFDRGSIGYGYGPNLRNFGGYLGNDYPEPEFGFDQLLYVINELKINPTSRRALFTLWRPDKLYKVKLPPCHHTYQFIVTPNEDREMKNLSCFMFQRSADYPIGVGHGNLLGGTLFTYLIAQQLGLSPKELVHSASHAHIYENQIESVKEYLSRIDEPRSPILQIKKAPNIDSYLPEMFSISDYNPLGSIKIPVAV